MIGWQLIELGIGLGANATAPVTVPELHEVHWRVLTNEPPLLDDMRVADLGQVLQHASSKASVISSSVIGFPKFSACPQSRQSLSSM